MAQGKSVPGYVTDRPDVSDYEMVYFLAYLDLFHSQNQIGTIPISEIVAYGNNVTIPDDIQTLMHTVRDIESELARMDKEKESKHGPPDN
jgi:hypothetical protein